jgi:cytidyltransferase-like protein
MNRVVIMVFGTFDYVHEGHLDFFKQAKALSEDAYLVVSIARDVNVEKIKGTAPKFSEQERLAAVEQTGLADEVVLGSVDNYLGHILSYKPDIIALGYDQRAYTDKLTDDLKGVGLAPQIIRLKPYFPEKYKSSLFKSKQ